MRLQLGKFVREKEPHPPPEGWQVIQSRLLKGGYWLAALIGLVVMGGLCIGLGIWASVVRGGGGLVTAGISQNPLMVSVVVLILYIPLHESIHLLGQPGWGFSERSVVVLWPAKLRFGVYYEGCMSRRRWLAMRLAPLAILSFLPAIVLALLQFFPEAVDLELGLSILIFLNALGSGGDILAALAVLGQVPRGGLLLFQAGRGYWK